MKTVFRRALFALLATFALLAAGDVATYDPAAWTADLDRIEADMAQGYANLDWIAGKRGLDLPRLDRVTRARLSAAHSRVRAFLAVRDFVHAFRDPHLRLHWGERPVEADRVVGVASDVTAGIATSYAGAEADCAKANYEEDDHAFDFPVARLSGWRSLGEGDFPFGVAGDVGVLRIAALGENKYAGACAKVARAGLDERALQLAVREHQQAALR